MSTIAERVAAGAAWLDKNRPGWVDRIDLETLDLGDPCRCVLGQEYGEYAAAPDEPLGFGRPEEEIAARLGFNAFVSRGDLWRAAADEFRALTAAWRLYVLERRLGAS